jgi:hypothetical protein
MIRAYVIHDNNYYQRNSRGYYKINYRSYIYIRNLIFSQYIYIYNELYSIYIYTSADYAIVKSYS